MDEIVFIVQRCAGRTRGRLRAELLVQRSVSFRNSMHKTTLQKGRTVMLSFYYRYVSMNVCRSHLFSYNQGNNNSELSREGRKVWEKSGNSDRSNGRNGDLYYVLNSLPTRWSYGKN